jgi:hypothetical protein
METVSTLHGAPLVPIHSGHEIWLNGAFTHDVKSVLNENLGGILGGMQC